MNISYDDLKKLIERCGVHEQLGPRGEGWGIEQNPHELATFLLALPDTIQTVLEIGTGYRAGLARFMSSMLGWHVTSIDIHNYGHRFSDIEFLVQLAPERLAGRVFDLVIIDGDHHYEAVKADYEQRASRARSANGSAVMFHDIAGLRDCEGVTRFWKEIAYTQKHKLRAGFHEAIAEGPQRAGIGWISQ